MLPSMLKVTTKFLMVTGLSLHIPLCPTESLWTSVIAMSMAPPISDLKVPAKVGDKETLLDAVNTIASAIFSNCTFVKENHI